MSPHLATADEIQTWLISKLSVRLEIEPQEVDVREPLANLGLGSTEAVILAGELAEWLGRKLSAALVYEYPTIEALAHHLAEPSDVAGSAKEAGLTRETVVGSIAVIGIGCRFPGAKDPDQFWQLLRNGVDAIGEVPGDRFDHRAFYDPDPAAPGKMNTRWGGYLAQVDQFDADFFGISPREASRMDPQQRLLLEVTWEALQDAGQVPERLVGTRTGVFIGVATNDYGRLQWNDLKQIDAYAGTGNALSIAANRISYLFDFHGPSLAVDTACSSSLVAVHLACSSLRSGESTLALAGGVNVILSPAIAINFSKAGAMAPDGRCKAFDARANGYVRSEGAGIVVLKPLSNALIDGDPIYAVIRGSAVNQDGKSNGLMAPNPLAQEAVLREAYRQAGVSPGKVHYVEAHGTGTLLGDPIEAKALGAVLGADRPPGTTCAVGSVKTNIGHLEAAAGIAGLIKVALALRHREIPPSLHFEQPNPHIPFEELPLRVQTTLGPWPMAAEPPLAGVSSFGFGGTNAHVVLEGVPLAAAETPDARQKINAHLLVLSARNPEALQSLAHAYQAFLAAPGAAASLADICYTAGVRLGHHDHRLAATGNSPAELTERLEAFLRGEARPGLSSGRRRSGRRKKLVFVFPGQGSQWFGMGRQLLEQSAVFRDVIERCDQAMRPYGDWSLLAELTTADAAQSRLNEIDIVQPALFAIQIALAALWRSWGVEPQAVVGHSLGEVAAAYVAGVLRLEDAVRVICQRSRLFKEIVGKGAMAAVELPIEEARRILGGFEDRVSIAANNGPSSTVLSGDPAALAAILDRLQRDDIFCRMVNVDFASHSPQMEPLRADLLQALEGLQPQAESVPIYSTVTGQVSLGMAFDASYWARNMRDPVLFAGAVQSLVEDGHDIFLEISPHPILLSALQQAFHHFGQDGAVLPSLRREEDAYAVLLGSLGGLYTLGYPVDWKLIYPTGGRCVGLPPYPWQRERCWLEPSSGDARTHQENASGNDARNKHPLLGRHIEAQHPAGTHVWQMTLDKSSLPFLDDHRIQGVAVLPASAYMDMALAAATEIFGAQLLALENIEFRRALFVPEGGTRGIQVILAESTDGAASFHIYSCAGGIGVSGNSWVLHATGKVCPQQGDGPSARGVELEALTQWRAQSTEATAGCDYYRRLGERGIHYGPNLQSIVQLRRIDGELLVEAQVPESAAADLSDFQIHPAILDAGLQVLGAAIAAESTDGDGRGIYLPTRIGQLQIHGRPGHHSWIHARISHRDADSAVGDVQFLDDAGRAVAEIQGVCFEYLGEETQRSEARDLNQWLYEFQWRPKAHETGRPATEGGSGSWLILSDRGGVGESLSAQLEARGERTIQVAHGECFEQTDGRRYSINPRRPEDMHRLFEAVLASDQPGCRGIVHLWSLDAAPAGETTPTTLETAENLGCGSALLLVQELARRELSNPPRLWLATQGAQAVGGHSSPLAIAQSPIWGLGRVVAQEHPAFWGGLVDLEAEPSLPDAAARHLSEEIIGADGEDQIAFRQGRRYVGRLVRQRPSTTQAKPLRWRADASYLISGGLGDLGLLVARWMVEQGARRLILLGRSGLPPRSSWSSVEPGSRLADRISVIRELESQGASVHLASVDVADEAALSGFLKEFRAEAWPAIRGVVHAAGVLRDGLLAQLDAASLHEVLRPKVLGGWLLDRLLRDEDLDFFVLFSSAGSLLGQPGQANYAAGNAFLDALAHHRQARGQAGLSINWGAWAGEGFADSPGGKRLAARLALLGISSMLPKRALEVLERLLGQSATQVMAVPVNWKQYREFLPSDGASPLLSDLAREGAETSVPAGRTTERRDALLAAEPAERRRLLHSYLIEQVSRVLGLSPSKLDLEQPLNHLGMDSLMAVELKNRIAVDLKVNVPVVKFLQGFSVEQAVTQVLDQLSGEAENPSTMPIPAAAQMGEQRNAERLLANLDQLSDEQVDSLLADMLQKEKDALRPSSLSTHEMR